MGKISQVIDGLRPAMVMVVVQTSMAGLNVLYKLVARDGMSLRVLIAYRYLFAAAFTVPLALFLERKSRPKLTWVVVCQAFLCGLLGGAMAQNLYVESLVLTSATFASAMTNLIPAITFTLAISFGMERLGWRTMAGKAKVVGTLMGIGGAMLLTFCKGPEIQLWDRHVDLMQLVGHVAESQHRDHSNRVLGALMALGSCSSYAAWLIIQGKMSQTYPCYYSSTALMSVMGSIQTVVFALCTERDWNQWKLEWDLRLLTVAYSGIVVSGLMVALAAWCVNMRGPLFVSIFNPLMLVIVAIAGSLVLDEKLHLGSVVGAVMIVVGLYAVLWGKSKEMKRTDKLMPSMTSHPIPVAATSSLENQGDEVVKP